MKYWDLSKELKSGKLRNAYLFYGDDEGFINSLTSNIRKASSVSPDDIFNFVRLDGQKVDLNELINAINTPPMMGDRKYIEVFRADFLTGSRSIKDSSEKIKVIQEVLENPPQDIVLVVYYTYENGQDKNDTKIKAIEKKADLKRSAVVRLPSMAKESNKTNSMRNEIIEETVKHVFNKRHIEIPKFVIPYVRDSFESGIEVLENDLEKILNYAIDREVRKEDFDLMLTKTGTMHIFNLTTLVVQGKTKDAIELYNELLPKMKHPMDFIATMGARLREAYTYKVAMVSKKNINEIMGIVKSPFEWLVRQKVEEYKSLSLERLSKMFDLLVEGEVRLKTNSQNAPKDVEILIMMLSSVK